MPFRPSPLDVRALAFALTLALAAAAAPAPGADGEAYSDEKYAFTLTVPGPWKSAPLQNFAVPGVARAAWTGDKGASVVAFIQEPGKAFSPRFLVDASADSMEKALGARALAREVRDVSGKRAMWLVVEAKGNGGAIDGKGDVLTTQHWVAVPREKDILVVLLTCPSDDYGAKKASFEKAVGGMTVGGEQTEEQKSAK